MKKCLPIILSAGIIMSALPAVAAESETVELQIGSPVMTVNGTEYSIDENGTVPIIVNDRTLLPVRAVVEAMGGEVQWDNETETLSAKNGDNEITLTIGSNTAYLNGEAQTLDTAPEIINDRTMFPIRFIAESFGYTVIWSQNTQKVTVIDADRIENIIPRGDLNPSAARFTGVSYMTSLHANDENTGIPSIGQVTFEPCTRTDWHYHDGGQILLVTEGMGVLGFEDEPARLMQPGDVIYIEPGKVHFHSAMNTGWFAHIAISPNPSFAKTNWLDKVSDAEYYEAIDEALANGTVRESGDTMFSADEIITDENLIGTWRKSNLVETEDVFNCPEVNSYALEANSRSGWHSHQSGQFIIVTGGTGVYQEENGDIRHIKAGDTISVQPGTNHWIGSDNGTLAFIAADGNAFGSDITWGSAVSDAEYSQALAE